jgi:tRNA modification GTPase
VLPGLRLAQPGEFTERAFLNDKIDLAQAEAIADLIDASTEAAARSASRSLSGDFSREIRELRDALVHLRMLVEATLDFPKKSTSCRSRRLRPADRLQAQLGRCWPAPSRGAAAKASRW